MEAPPPPHPLAPWDPSPATSLGRPLPEPCKKSQGGVGGRGKERAGREGVWLEGRVLQLQWGDVGDPPNTSWGQTHIWGLPIPWMMNAALRGCEKTGKFRRTFLRLTLHASSRAAWRAASFKVPRTATLNPHCDTLDENRIATVRSQWKHPQSTIAKLSAHLCSDVTVRRPQSTNQKVNLLSKENSTLIYCASIRSFGRTLFFSNTSALKDSRSPQGKFQAKVVERVALLKTSAFQFWQSLARFALGGLLQLRKNDARRVAVA